MIKIYIELDIIYISDLSVSRFDIGVCDITNFRSCVTYFHKQNREIIRILLLIMAGRYENNETITF